jgi:hypothetical protein
MTLQDMLLLPLFYFSSRSGFSQSQILSNLTKNTKNNQQPSYQIHTI